MIFFNRTTFAVGGKLGAKSIWVKPGTTVKIADPIANDGDYPVKLAYSVNNDPEILPLADTVWRHRSKKRQLFFILPDVERGGPRVWSVKVTELPKDPKEKE
jgi:hypothetical protein